MTVLYDWRAAASRVDVTPLEVVLELRKDWPRDDRWRQPNRTADVDRLAGDAEMVPLVRGVIDDLAARKGAPT